jgi:homogentisate 1,2-dioxygenase
MLNRRTWTYRIRPRDARPFAPFVQADASTTTSEAGPVTPDQLRWNPAAAPDGADRLHRRLFTMAGNGSPRPKAGIGIHVYVANRDMTDRYFYNADARC